MKFHKKFIILYVLAAVILIGAIGSSVYFYLKYQDTKRMLADPQSVTTETNKKLLENLGKLIQLPTDETPTIATVTDTEKLKEQPFFANAKNGDKLIVYSGTRKAILYDPVTNRIIDVAPVNIGTESATTVTPAASEMTGVAVYNGTATVGLSGVAEKLITDKLGSGYEVLLKENAGRKDYEKTLVVDLAGAGSEKTGAVAQVFEAEIVPLPDGEKKPVIAGNSADILVILGSDFKGN